MQKSGEAHEEAGGEAEKLPLLRHVTREHLGAVCTVTQKNDAIKPMTELHWCVQS